MSSTRNPDSLTNAQGEFKPRIERDEPLTTKGHAVGTKVGNDAKPEFHAETLPAGTAPADRTFQPNPINETPGQANNPDSGRGYAKENTSTGALDFPGATSQDVHTGLGHPGSGQVASDIKHKGGQGLHGTTGSTLNEASQRDDPKQRGLQRETGDLAGTKGKGSSDYPAAEDRIPESAETVASERA